MVLIHDLPSVKTLGYFQGAGTLNPNWLPYHRNVTEREPDRP